MDYVAPLFPVYDGSRLLAALCMGVLCGIGYAMIFMRGSSTGGQDFISVAIKKVKPHITLGIITFVLDICTIILGTALVFKDIDGLIYGDKDPAGAGSHFDDRKPDHGIQVHDVLGTGEHGGRLRPRRRGDRL